MMIGEFLKNPLLRRALTEGEERVGKLVGQLVSDERFTRSVQAVVASAQGARSTIDRGIKAALRSASLPTTEDVAELKKRLSELERLLDDLAVRAAHEKERESDEP